MIDKELIETLERSESNLFVELRGGKGFNVKEYRKLVKALSNCADEWENRTSIPRDAVITIVTLYDELYNFSLNYKDVRIKEAGENIKRLIQRCTKEKGKIEREKVKIIDRIVAEINENGNFFEKLERGDGLDDQQFERIYQAIHENIDEIYSWEETPKILVKIFIDLMELDLYVQQYKEEEADKIYDAYERIFSLIIG